MSRAARSTPSPTQANTCDGDGPLRHQIRVAAYNSDDAALLTAEVQLEYVRRYGGEGDTAPIDTSEFDGAGGAFFMIYVDDVAAGMGGWRRYGNAGDAEIKRMYVRPPYQRQGLARALLNHLEETASSAGFSRLILETGLPQPEAVAMYRAGGYEEVPAFGFYAGMPLSVHLGKVLSPRRVES